VVTGIEISIGIIVITAAGDPADTGTGQHIMVMDETATGIITMPTIIAVEMIMVVVEVAVTVVDTITMAAVEITAVVTMVMTAAQLATAIAGQIPADVMIISIMTPVSGPELPAHGIIAQRNRPAEVNPADRPITSPAATADKLILLAQKRAHAAEPDR
jgi:hypothetical protein